MRDRARAVSQNKIDGDAYTTAGDVPRRNPGAATTCALEVKVNNGREGNVSAERTDRPGVDAHEGSQ